MKLGGNMAKVLKDSNDKTLDQVLQDIEKQFGKGSIMRLGENHHMEVETTSSGSLCNSILSFKKS